MHYPACCHPVSAFVLLFCMFKVEMKLDRKQCHSSFEPNSVYLSFVRIHISILRAANFLPKAFRIFHPALLWRSDSLLSHHTTVSTIPPF